MAHIKQFAPSLVINGEIATLSVTDLCRLLRPLAETIKVDEKWYLARNADVQDAVIKGEFASGKEHFYSCGFVDGRLSAMPDLDEAWYLSQYPDVAEAIKAHKFHGALQHYLDKGAQEGRLPKPAKL